MLRSRELNSRPFEKRRDFRCVVGSSSDSPRVEYRTVIAAIVRFAEVRRYVNSKSAKSSTVSGN